LPDADAIDHGDPYREIERLEDEIEALAGKIESCRKFILAGRIAIGAGAVVLVATLSGVIRTDLGWMAASMAAVIGGIVVFGSNNSTAKEAAKEMAEAEAERSALIGQIELRDISIAPTLH
jgi:hypothetical protein